ncbi:MAG TPA: HD domain-containing protein [bacterium]|nr:HD domain-containing protein [bacterium]HQL61736.1 HD domain-containing protein [bacterium]
MGIEPHNVEDHLTEYLIRLAGVAECRDPDVPVHLRRISLCSRIMTRHIGWMEHQVTMIGYAALAHDIGKIAVPEAVLLKPGPLTPEEYEISKRHTTVGAEILGDSDVPLVRMAARIALSHHERWDGAGYPSGLQGEKIPLEARIVSVIDVFDALVGSRCYKEPIRIDRSIQILRENSGMHFDPAIVGFFVECLDEILHVYRTG